MEIDFDKCSDLALVLTRKVVSEFELDQRGLDEVAVYNVILKGIVEYEKIAAMRPTPLEQLMAGPDLPVEVTEKLKEVF